MANGTNTPPRPGPSAEPSARERLDSWKEIAAYLRRDERTVRRWEKAEGLPVHRHPHLRQSSVFAYKAELDEWWNNGHERLGAIELERAAALGRAAIEAAQGLAAGGRAERRGWASRWPLLAFGAAVVTLAAVGIYFAIWRGEGGPKPAVTSNPPTIAVLPFQLPRGQQEGSLGLALADSLAWQLHRTSNLRTLPPSAGYPFRKFEGDPAEAGRRVGATLVLAGNAERDGGEVHLQASLVRVADGTRLWSHSLTLPESGFHEAQASIAAGVAQQLGVPAAAKESAVRMAAQATTALSAYENYVEGKYQLARRSSAGISRAMDSFELALRKDPRFVPARTGLAMACAFDLQRWQKAEQLARSALELDPGSSEAHAVLGFVRMFWRRDWEGARQEFMRAVDLDPQNSTARHWYGLYFLAQSNGGEAKAEMDMALKLDSFSPAIHTDMGELQMLAGLLDDALASCNQALALDPDFLNAHICAYRIHLRRNRGAEARAKVQEIQQRFHRDLVFAMESYVLAEEAALQGRENEALHWLEEAYAGNSLSVVFAGANPAFAGLLKNPRFQGLLRKLSLAGGPPPAPSQSRVSPQPR